MNGWNEIISTNVSIYENNQTYQFEYQIIKVSSDKSGLIFGLSNNNESSLDNINMNIVGYSCKGSEYNYKYIQKTNVNSELNNNDKLKVIINTQAKTIQWFKNDQLTIYGD